MEGTPRVSACCHHSLCMPNIAAALAKASTVVPAPLSWFSQQCEDQFFFKYFLPQEQITRQHTYLELGASNGIDASNTRTLYEHLNWRGVLIEAAPQQCKNLVKHRPGDVVFCGAVCDQSFGGTLTFQTDQNKGGLVGHSVDMGTPTVWWHMYRHIHFVNYTVPCAPLGTMLEVAGMRRVDFFSLDVEQQELRVLKTINWSAFRFSVAFIELECTQRRGVLGSQDKHVRSFLSKHGYQYVMRESGNDVWIDPSVPWAKKGAARAIAAARGGSMARCMLDAKCGDGRGEIGD